MCNYCRGLEYEPVAVLAGGLPGPGGQAGDNAPRKGDHMSNSKDRTQDAGGISVHAVDIARGVPAVGLKVKLWNIDGDRVEVAEGECSDSGLLLHPVSDGAGVLRGMYEIEFDVAAYYRACGVDVPAPSFLETAVFRFGIDKVTEHFHLPFKFTPWGFSLFRGGA